MVFDREVLWEKLPVVLWATIMGFYEINLARDIKKGGEESRRLADYMGC